MKSKPCAFLVLLAGSMALVAGAQQVGPDKPTAFDVASVRPHGPRGPDWGPSDPFNKTPVRDPILLSAHNRTLKTLVRWAFGVEYFQVSGGPAWVETEGYDVEARANSPSTPEQMMLMLRTLLADRFQLTFHRETRQLLLNVLSLAKGGPKIGLRFHAVNENDPPAPPGKSVPDQISFRGMSIKVFANYLRLNMTRDLLNHAQMALDDIPPVLDRTGLTQRYDIIVNTGSEDDWPTILERQLGLKLELSKVPMEVIVVDTAVKPSAN